MDQAARLRGLLGGSGHGREPGLWDVGNGVAGSAACIHASMHAQPATAGKEEPASPFFFFFLRDAGDSRPAPTCTYMAYMIQ